MGNALFGIDIAGIVADAVGDGLPDVTIVRQVRGARDPSKLTAGQAKTTETHTGIKGFWEDYQPNQIDGTNVLLNDRKAVLIGDTLPTGFVPREGDEITVHEDLGDVTLGVVKLQSRDPAAATYVVQCGDRTGPDGQ